MGALSQQALEEKCRLLEQGFSPASCAVWCQGRRRPACRVTLKWESGKLYRLIKAAHLSRPEHYFSIYQSGCNWSYKKCHSWEFTQYATGDWMSPEDIEVRIDVDGQEAFVPERISVREALELLGYPVASGPGEEGIFAPCRVGGCWSCIVKVDGSVKRACVTPVKDGLIVKTFLSRDYTPQRIVHGFMGHTVGGMGTPWYLKGTRYVEVACFAAGCNFRCPQCQNWATTYRGRGKPLTPSQAAETMTNQRRRLGAGLTTVICQTEFGHIGP